MELGITNGGILTLKGTPDAGKKYEFLIRSSQEVIEIKRTKDDYWESESPVKDGYYIYVNSDTEASVDSINTILDTDVDSDSSETELFTMLNLRNCLLNYEKKIVGDALCNCTSGSGVICGNSSDRQMADFLLSTVYVIEYLVCTDRKQDAAEILEKVHNCNGVCQESIIKNKKCSCC